MSRAVATLEIRDASKLTPLQAQQFARILATRKKTAIIRHGPVRAELRVQPQVGRAHLARWLEEQGVKLIYDRTSYADRYVAKLFGPAVLSEAA
jgi:hypothetical protein